MKIKVVFSLEKNFLSDEEIIPFELYDAPRRTKIGIKDVTFQYKLHHFQIAEKPETAKLINFIYECILV